MNMSRLGRILPTLVALLLLIVFVRLGFWQLNRAESKLRQEQTLQRNREAAPTPLQLSSLQPDQSSWHYRQYRLQGRYDPRRQYLLDNRIYRGRAGFQVLTLFSVQGRGVLVNRGWIPLGSDRERLPALTVRTGRLTLTGRLVPLGKRGPLLGEAGYSVARWPKIIQQLNMEKIQSQIHTKLIPAIVQLDAGSEDCYVCDWAAQRGGMSSDRHRGYALQWFSLAAALVCLYLLTVFRKPRHERP